jgi:hypothetical protein
MSIVKSGVSAADSRAWCGVPYSPAGHDSRSHRGARGGCPGKTSGTTAAAPRSPSDGCDPGGCAPHRGRTVSTQVA